MSWATKGFEPGSGRFLHEVAGEALGPGVPLAVVTGPSFAKEVALGLPTAPPKATDRRAFEGETVQAEAIPPDVLSQLVAEAIEARQDARTRAALLIREAEGRADLLDRLGGAQ